MADASEKSGLAEGEPLEADEVDVEPELVPAEDADKDEPSSKTALVPQDSLGRYLAEIRRYPLSELRGLVDPRLHHPLPDEQFPHGEGRHDAGATPAVLQPAEGEAAARSRRLRLEPEADRASARGQAERSRRDGPAHELAR